MVLRLRKLLKWSSIGLIFLALLVVREDTLRLNPAEAAAAPYIYDLVGWHLTNFPSKWFHKVVRTLPWNSLSKEEKRRRVEEYFRLSEEIRGLGGELDRAVAQTGDEASAEVIRLETELEQMTARRSRLRNDVEEVLEAAISSVVLEGEIGSWGELIFPPVDIRLTDTPKLLVTSPRDRIVRTHDALLRPDVSVEQREEVEDKLLRESNLSALVTNLGGLSTYPASLTGTRSLRSTLQIAAHEWLHHYFFFRPLGQNISRSADMRSLNETVADIAGREIGDRAFEMLGGTIEEPSPSANPEAPVDMGDAAEAEEEDFDFNREMRKTRLRADELLAEGRIEEAEEYMEERREFIVENGVHIRKLNQAFFAFHGTYAESSSSVSPIGDQLQQFRELMPDLGAFVRKMDGISSYQGFLDKLEQLKSRAETP